MKIALLRYRQKSLCKYRQSKKFPTLVDECEISDLLVPHQCVAHLKKKLKLISHVIYVEHCILQ